MSFIGKLMTAIKFLFDKDVPMRKKLWIILPALYILSPIDLIPAPVLGLSVVDDLVLLLFVIGKISEKLDEYANNNSNKNQEDKDREKIVEDVEYEIIDEEK
ncbi:YkvA family protein [Caldisalinibacter kiritimatiensis]|uniref:Uncharacterized protein n=1 Tax=Caldisalinibacter kiritimatiensis TaxID=1304284 RepID=R1ATS6_9FIRM|nr:DUF1232 domain-containing protein [Caldisalinibacter kiritimatiensis]EOD00503.1 hypothetical protein L21TH_1450 [Caldisalinibacter kiritimatiensis]